jgi:hypothetical protein
VALFRYSVVSQVEALVLAGQRVSVAVRRVAARTHRRDDDAGLKTVSPRSIHRWRRAYASGGIAALEPRIRAKTATSTVLPSKLIEQLRAQKSADPAASIPEVLRRVRVAAAIPADLAVSRTTLWRACRRMELPTRIRQIKSEGDMRRWRYPERMQCVLCDGKHFRAGPERARRVALFFLDDATRFGLGVLVGTSESTELFLRGLHAMVANHGLADIFFLDGGPGFISDDTWAVIAEGLRANLVHGRSRYPEGHGAIERFNRTAKAQVLRALDGAIDVDPDCRALTLRLGCYLERYNDTFHETLQQTPRQAWQAGRPLRLPEDQDDLYRRFVVRELRTVSADHVIQFGGRLWEAPRGTQRSKIEVARHAIDGRLWVTHGGRTFLLAELDPHTNAVQRRGYPSDHAPAPGQGVPITAASEAFRLQMQPIINPDGGFSDKE